MKDWGRERMYERKRLKAARIAKGVTQAELAQRIGVTTQAISSFEKGAKAPKMETVKRIAEALGISVAELYGRMDLAELWSNAACMGYCLIAMRRANLRPGAQRRVLMVLEQCFDDVSVEDAEKAGYANTEG